MIATPTVIPTTKPAMRPTLLSEEDGYPMTTREVAVTWKPKALGSEETAVLISELAAAGVTLSLVGVAEPPRTVDPATQLVIVIASVLVLFSPRARRRPAMKVSIPERRKVSTATLRVNLN